MRQQLLHGYVLHQRPYRENSRLVQYFCMEAGRVDGVARQSLPALYQPSLLYATGKTSLKAFARIEPVGSPVLVSGAGLLAGFYLNELLVRLLPVEEAYPALFASYASSLAGLQQLQGGQDSTALRALLRRFEWALLDTLGALPDFVQDALGQPIDPAQSYRYVAGQGLLPDAGGALPGAQLLQVSANALHAQVPTAEVLQLTAQVFRQEIARQLGDRPLHSRELWRQMSLQSRQE